MGRQSERGTAEVRRNERGPRQDQPVLQPRQFAERYRRVDSGAASKLGFHSAYQSSVPSQFPGKLLWKKVH